MIRTFVYIYNKVFGTWKTVLQYSNSSIAHFWVCGTGLMDLGCDQAAAVVVGTARTQLLIEFDDVM